MHIVHFFSLFLFLFISLVCLYDLSLASEYFFLSKWFNQISALLCNCSPHWIAPSLHNITCICKLNCKNLLRNFRATHLLTVATWDSYPNQVHSLLHTKYYRLVNILHYVFHAIECKIIWEFKKLEKHCTLLFWKMHIENVKRIHTRW